MSAVWLILIFAQAQKVLNAQIVAATTERRIARNERSNSNSSE